MEELVKEIHAVVVALYFIAGILIGGMVVFAMIIRTFFS